MGNWDIAMTALAIGIGMALAASIGALSQSKAIWGAVEAIARQPEATNKIQLAMIIAAALIEGAALFAIVVAMITK